MKKTRIAELDAKATHYMNFGNKREKTLGIGMKIVLKELNTETMTEAMKDFIESKLNDLKKDHEYHTKKSISEGNKLQLAITHDFAEADIQEYKDSLNYHNRKVHDYHMEIGVYLTARDLTK